MNSRLASCNAKIMQDFDDVIVMVSFTYRHETIVLPYVDKSLVCDQPL